MKSTSIESMALEARVSLFAALGDPIRLRVLDELAGCGKCVCDLQQAIEIAPNLLSYHLRVLREVGLVAGIRRGRWVDYTVTAEAEALISAASPLAR